MSTLSDVSPLIRVGGGNTFFPMLADWRDAHDAGGAIADTIDDIRGAGFGPQLTAPAAGQRPAINNGLVFTAAASSLLQSAQDARLLLSQTTAFHFLWIGKVLGGGYVAGVCANPASAVTYPYAFAKAGGVNWSMEAAATGAGDLFTLDLGTPWNDNTARAIAIGRRSNKNAVAPADGNVTYDAHLGGRQGSAMPALPAATVVAGGLRIAIGGFGGVFTNCTMKFFGIYTGDLSLEFLTAFRTYAETIHGAGMDRSKRGTLAVPSNSYGTGFNSTHPLGYGAGQDGSTTVAHELLTNASGLRGALGAQGFETNLYSVVYAASGRGIDHIMDNYNDGFRLLLDPLRTGPNVMLLFELLSNSICNTPYSAIYGIAGGEVALEAQLRALHTLVSRDGWVTGIKTIHDRDSFYTPSGTGAANAKCTVAKNMNALMLANYLTYAGCKVVYNNEADANLYFTIDAVARGLAASNRNQITGVAGAAFPAAIFNNDHAHVTDATAAYLGGSGWKATLDANDSVLWPPTVRTRLRRR